MTQFRKRPIVIEAVRLTEKTEIKTREGTLYGYPGEWLLTGVKGEVYPCGDEIFRATYENIDGTKITPACNETITLIRDGVVKHE